MTNIEHFEKKLAEADICCAVIMAWYCKTQDGFCVYKNHNINGNVRVICSDATSLWDGEMHAHKTVSNPWAMEITSDGYIDRIIIAEGADIDAVLGEILEDIEKF